MTSSALRGGSAAAAAASLLLQPHRQSVVEGGAGGRVLRHESLAEGDEEGEGVGGVGVGVGVGSMEGGHFRRRAVDASDLRTCAMVQSKLKNWKTYPFP